MQADPEHQQDHADFGQFVRQRLIGDIARRERADHDTRQHIADQRRYPQPIGDQREQEGEHQSCHHRADQRSDVRFRQCASPPWPSPN
jgi:hypothetical protein